MIREITRTEANRKLYIFPKIFFETKIEEDTGNSKINIKTYVEKQGYLVLLRKQFSYRTELKLDYRQLMNFIDSLQPDINRFLIHAKVPFKSDNVLGIYKIIEE